MSKHTPGPWNNFDGPDIYCIYAAGQKKICSIEPVDIVGWNAVFRDEAEANERLIAAAPDLLSALERIAREHDCGCVPCLGSCRGKEALEITVEEIQEIARAAIAKARVKP